MSVSVSVTGSQLCCTCAVLAGLMGPCAKLSEAVGLRVCVCVRVRERQS